MLSELKEPPELLAEAAEAEKRSNWTQAITVYETLLRQSAVEQSSLRAQVLRRIGIVHYYRGDFELADELYEASIECARACGAWPQLASGLNSLAISRQGQGDLANAETLYQEARRAAEQAGHRRLLVMIQQNLGTMASLRGDSDTALDCYRSALVHYEEDQDSEGIVWVLNNLALVHVHKRDFAQAEGFFQRALRLAEERRDTQMIATIQLNRGEMFVAQQAYGAARQCADTAFGLFTRIDSKQGLGEAAKLYGVLYREDGKLTLAESYLSVVTNIARASDFRMLHAEAEAELALVHLAAGRNREALRSLNLAHRLFTEMRARRELADVAHRLEKLERKYLTVTQVWGESIESCDQHTAGHCARVADYATRLAAAVGFSGRELTWLRMGAFLHDVGNTALPAALLAKPGKLDRVEWEQMTRHTLAGDALVADMDFPWDVRPIVRNHHEHWDGSGYPDGLQGEEIPLPARIVCVADVFDALTTTRSYRPAHSVLGALQIMRGEVGTVLDPALFEVFWRSVIPGVAAEVSA